MDIDYLNGVALVADRKNSAKDVTGTVETDLLNGEIVLPAGALGTRGLARFTLWGDLELDGALSSWPIFKFKLGATTVFSMGSAGAGFPISATRGSWKVVAELLNLGAANSQVAHFSMLMYGNDGTGTTTTAQTFTGGARWIGHLTGPSNDWTLAPGLWEGIAAAAVDTTVDQTAAFTVTLRNATGDDCNLLGSTLELV